MANLAKAALGRPTHLAAGDVLFRRYLRQCLGLGRIDSVTSIATPAEGAGSHALMAMRAMRFARRFGLTYVHTPLAGIHHADRPAAAWEAAWEETFNLGEGEARTGADPVNYALTFPDLHRLFGVAEGDDTPFDAALVRDFRRRYRANKLPRAMRPFTVAVHLRQRNAHDFHDDDVADLPRLARTLAEVRTALDRRGIAHDLEVFSQGAPERFGVLGVPARVLHLDTDPVAAMRDLVAADLLVIGGGTFSAVAGILCEGIVVADATASPRPQPWWHTYDPTGRIDAEALDRALEAGPAAA
jgi:hypothetical protein